MSDDKPDDVAREELVRGFKSLLNSGHGADMTIVCQDTELHYHSAIVCSRSAFFAAAIWGNFQEGESKRIHLHNEKLSMVRRMMRYFYVLDYDEEEEEEVEVEGGTCMMEEAQMYAMADRYGIHGLKILAMSRFSVDVHNRLIEVERWIIDTKGDPDGKSELEESELNDLLACVEIVFTSTPDTDRRLREELAKFTVQLQSFMTLTDKPIFKHTCQRFPAFAFEIIREEEMGNVRYWQRPRKPNAESAGAGAAIAVPKMLLRSAQKY